LTEKPSKSCTFGGGGGIEPAKCALFDTANERNQKNDDSLAEQSEFELSGDFVWRPRGAYSTGSCPV
jgi:hypothetical protein